MAPYLKITTHPPLGQLTVVSARQEQIQVMVLIEWNRARPGYPFELALCYASSKDSAKHESTWPSVPLAKVANPRVVKHEDAWRSSFQTTLSKSDFCSGGSSEVVKFTVKYRVNESAPWQWVSGQQRTSPGRLLLQVTETLPRQELDHVLALSADWYIEALQETDQLTQVFHLRSTKPIPKSLQSSDEEQLFETVLGKVNTQLQYMALVRDQPYWIVPRQGNEFFYLAEDAVLCSFLLSSGHVLTMIPMPSVKDTFIVFRSNRNGEIVVAARCDSNTDAPFNALAAVAPTFEESCTAVMTAARGIVNGQAHIQEMAKGMSESATAPDQTAEAWLDGLMFCTWNALGQHLTESKILSALDSLTASNINIATLLIDDNWQTLGPVPDLGFNDSFNRGFSDLTANPLVAPDGLASLITKIKRSHPHITNVGLWHALLGYWAGISPAGKIAQDYATTSVSSYLIGNVPATITSVASSDLERFYTDFYTYLSQSGISFIKTDVQHMLSMFRSRSDRLDLINAYQSVWTSSHTRFFGSRAISCMSQVPQTLFSSLLQTHTPKVLLRNSDDFYPEIPASHPWHIWVNAHNACFTRHLNVIPDWDMFQTSHQYSAYHAAARCISGGPVMITDVPGEHDVELINAMTALDARGRRIALRPEPARATRVFDEYTEGNLLMIGTTTKAGGRLLGLWNVAEKDASCMISIGDFPDLKGMNGKVVVRSYKAGEVFGPFDLNKVLDHKDGVGVDGLIYTTIPVRDWDITTMYPVTTAKLGGREISIAPLGLADKIGGAAAILEWDCSSVVDDGANSVCVKVKLKVLGKCALWVETPAGTKLSGADATVGGVRTVVHRVQERWGVTDATIVDVDTEGSWKLAGLFDSENKNVHVEFQLSFE